MQQTGIVRRIDELGRVVIPKEMRKTLRIKEGDPLEIFTNKEELIFKKYSPLNGYNDVVQVVVDSIAELTQKECLMVDTDTVISVSTSKLKELVGKKISSAVINVINDRKSIVNNRVENGEIISIVEREEIKFESQIILPIIVNGDCYGAIVLVSRERGDKLGADELRAVRLGEKVIAKQLS